MAQTATPEIGDVFGEPVTRRLGGQELKFRPITFGMMSEFYRTRRAEHRDAVEADTRRRIALVLDNLPDDFPPADRGKLLLQITASEVAYNVESDLNTPDGAILLLTLSAKGAGESVSRDDIGRLFPFDQATAMQLVTELLPGDIVTPDERRIDLVRQARKRLRDWTDHPPSQPRPEQARCIRSVIKLLDEALGEDGDNPPGDAAAPT